MKLTVGIIGRASGVRGQVRLSVKTDNPQQRFAPGTVLLSDNADFPELTVSVAQHSGSHFVVGFNQVPDRNTAESLKGTRLFIDSQDSAQPDSEGYYPHQLAGLPAQTPTGKILGTINDLLLGSAQDLLEVLTPQGETVLVPFVFDLVPVVDLEAGLVVIDPPGGLFPSPEN